MNNGDLLHDVETIESAWHTCAAQIDTVIDCQRRLKKLP